MTLPTNWQVLPTQVEVAQKAADIILAKSAQAIATDGIFKIVLAGGTTPLQAYTVLLQYDAPWEKWHFFLGDERCLPQNDKERNSQMIYDTFLRHINVPQDNIHFIAAENDIEITTKKYAQIITDYLPFHLTLLGVGEDGHTASLFPGHMYNEDDMMHSVYNSPKPPSKRITMSRRTLSSSADVVIIATGTNKQKAITLWQQGEDLPIADINARRDAIVLLDASAIST